MRDAKIILSLVGDIYMTANPNFFYQQVIYYPFLEDDKNSAPFLSLSDIFVDQIDTKLIEEQSEERLSESLACFFFKN